MTANRALSQPMPDIHERVRETYERLARNPYAHHPLHRGPYYARNYLGYADADLEASPKVAADRFTGVGNPFAAGDIHPGETVLDIGCGAGTDLVIAARRTGPDGRVIGVDPSPAMRQCAVRAARAAGLETRIEVRAGRGEGLPLDGHSVDLVICNGVLSLSEQKLALLREVRRVLRPGGRLYLADAVADRGHGFDAGRHADLWDACIGGALMEDELAELAARAGLRQGQLVGCYDCFRNTPAAERLGGGLRVHGVTFCAIR